MDEIDYDLRKLNAAKILEEAFLTDDELSAYHLIAVIVFLTSTVDQVLHNPVYSWQSLVSDLQDSIEALKVSLGALDQEVTERAAEVYSACHGAMVE